IVSLDGRVMDTSGYEECTEYSYPPRRVRSTFHRPRNPREAAAGEVGTLRRGAGKHPCKGRQNNGHRNGMVCPVGNITAPHPTAHLTTQETSDRTRFTRSRAQRKKGPRSCCAYDEANGIRYPAGFLTGRVRRHDIRSCVKSRSPAVSAVQPCRFVQ